MTAFRQSVEAMIPALRRYARALARDADIADDLVQDTLVRALRRSWTLTRGWQAWRVLGITLLAGLVTGLFATMVQLPVTTVTFLALDGLSGGLSPVHPGVLLTDHLVQVVVQAFSIPFSAGVTALLYLDLRIRREGLDVSLVRAAQARAVGRAR